MSKPHPTESAEKYCCIQAAEIIAATTCAGIQAAGIIAATKCAVWCAHRPVLVVEHATCLCCCCCFFFFWCLDFSFFNGHVILEKWTNAYEQMLQIMYRIWYVRILPRKKPSAREIRCTLQGCCLRRIQLSMPLLGTLHCAVFRRFVRFSAIKTWTSTHTTTSPPHFCCCRPTLSNRSVFPQKILPIQKLTKHQSERLRFSHKLPTDIHCVSLVLRKQPIFCVVYTDIAFFIKIRKALRDFQILFFS